MRKENSSEVKKALLIFSLFVNFLSMLIYIFSDSISFFTFIPFVLTPFLETISAKEKIKITTSDLLVIIYIILCFFLGLKSKFKPVPNKANQFIIHFDKSIPLIGNFSFPYWVLMFLELICVGYLTYEVLKESQSRDSKNPDGQTGQSFDSVVANINAGGSLPDQFNEVSAENKSAGDLLIHSTV